MAFAHPNGIDILLLGLGADRARFPAEVYNRDEDALPPGEDDAELSELARGLRYARRQATPLLLPDAELYAARLAHAAQIREHLDRATLVQDALTVDELPLREQYRDDFDIGRGEAACLVLAHRYGASALFISSDVAACRVASELGVTHITLPEVLAGWINAVRPAIAEIDALVAGMRIARFGLTPATVAELKSLTQS